MTTYGLGARGCPSPAPGEEESFEGLLGIDSLVLGPHGMLAEYHAESRRRIDSKTDSVG